MAALAQDFDPDYYDRQESLAEWREFMNAPTDAEYWLNLARHIVAPLPARDETEVEF